MSSYEWSLLDTEFPMFWSWESLDVESIETYLYFIQQGEEGPIKIGVSKHPDKRLRELQTANAVELVLLGTHKGIRSDEKRIHKMFENNRLSGEWFEPCLPLLSLVEELKD